MVVVVMRELRHPRPIIMKGVSTNKGEGLCAIMKRNLTGDHRKKLEKESGFIIRKKVS